MKYRNGFVSNSSSSSFIVGFDKKPESIQEIKQVLFGEKEFYYSPFEQTHWTTEKIAAIVFRDLGEPLSKEDVVNEISSGSFTGEPPYEYGLYSKFDWKTEEGKKKIRKVQDEYNKRREIAACKVAEEFLKETKDKVLFEFTYADDEGPLSGAMEHGDLFQELPHVRVSHH